MRVQKYQVLYPPLPPNAWVRGYLLSLHLKAENMVVDMSSLLVGSFHTSWPTVV